jgi:hypothetical protein
LSTVNYRFAFFLGCLVALPVFAAGDLISDRAYFEDPTNQLTYVQAKQQLFVQNIGGKSF